MLIAHEREGGLPTSTFKWVLHDRHEHEKDRPRGVELSISRSIIDAHGSRVWAEAHQPRGTVFRITLPVSN